ncbi:MAG: hypothetical protein M1480_21635 [Bacteroidetes bacterium]|nr:hypothetical protein [Bacteroidota bacterium]
MTNNKFPFRITNIALAKLFGQSKIRHVLSAKQFVLWGMVRAYCAKPFVTQEAERALCAKPFYIPLLRKVHLEMK